MNLTLKPTYCKKTQKQRLKERFKFNFQARNKTKLHDSKTKHEMCKTNMKTYFYYANIC